MNILQGRGRLSTFAGIVALAALLGSAPPAAYAGGPVQLAQNQPGDAPDDGGDGGGDASAMLLRVGRLETQIRSLTGQIEQLQFQNKRLEDNLRKMQQDVDFRFQDLQGHPAPIGAGRPVPVQRRGDAESPAPADATATADVTPPPPPAVVPARPARTAGDAFDPNADPNAPGAPRPLGTTPPSQPLATRTASARAGGSRAPLDLMQRSATTPDQGGGIAGAGTDTPEVIAAPPAARPLPNPNAVASLAPGGTREEFDADLGLYKQGQFDGAATGFQSFVEKYPKDRLVPDAVYLLGESYSKLGRHREAAEQFLKLSTDYGKSTRAPDALLRLGMSLNALGAKEQACATYQEVNRRYPAASADVRAGVDRELKRSHCQG
jgi:tol-pal system protein YbgF